MEKKDHRGNKKKTNLKKLYIQKHLNCSINQQIQRFEYLLGLR